MRTLEDCVGVVACTGEGLRFMRFAHGSCSCFITLFTPVSQDATLLLGIRPVGNVSVLVKSKTPLVISLFFNMLSIIPWSE